MARERSERSSRSRRCLDDFASSSEDDGRDEYAAAAAPASSRVFSSGSVTVSPHDTAPPFPASRSISTSVSIADTVPERRTLKTSLRSEVRVMRSSVAMDLATASASTATHPSAKALVDVRAPPSSDEHGSVPPGHPRGARDSSSESTTLMEMLCAPARAATPDSMPALGVASPPASLLVLVERLDAQQRIAAARMVERPARSRRGRGR